MPICLQLYSLLQHICFATVPGSFGDRWAAAQPFRWCRALPLIQPVHGQMDRQPWHTPSSLEKREGRHSTADTPCWSPVSFTVSTDGFSTSFSFSFLAFLFFFLQNKRWHMAGEDGWRVSQYCHVSGPRAHLPKSFTAGARALCNLLVTSAN